MLLLFYGSCSCSWLHHVSDKNLVIDSNDFLSRCSLVCDVVAADGSTTLVTQYIVDRFVPLFYTLACDATRHFIPIVHVYLKVARCGQAGGS